MAALVALHGVALRSGARTLSLSVNPGEAYALMSPDDGGASALLAVACGRSESIEGYGERFAPLRFAPGTHGAWRMSPQTIALRAAGKGENTRVAEALSACGLWDDRRRPLSALSADQQEAAQLLPVLAGPEPILAIDGLLDSLGPWLLPQALAVVRTRLSAGACVLAATQRPDIAQALSRLVVVRDGGVRFVGTCEELIQRATPSEAHIHTRNRSVAQALAEPLAISVGETADGLVVRTEHGRDLAAKLVVEGYGAVEMVTLREPTLAEALAEL